MILTLFFVTALLIVCIAILYEIRNRSVLSVICVALNSLLTITIVLIVNTLLDIVIENIMLWCITVVTFVVWLYYYETLYMEVDFFSTFVTKNVQEIKAAATYTHSGKFVPNSTVPKWIPVDK